MPAFPFLMQLWQDNICKVSEATDEVGHVLRPGEHLGVHLGLVKESLSREQGNNVVQHVSTLAPCRRTDVYVAT